MRYALALFSCIFLSFDPVFTMPDNPDASPDTLMMVELQHLPQIDAVGDDPCWDSLEWNEMNYVWYPWGENVDSTDFYGRFKIGWSSRSNLLYAFLEIRDDIVSDRYAPGKSAAIYNFDMFEIFIDEDRSGGWHVFDGGGTADSVFGLNAENAFGYHICTIFPDTPDDPPLIYFEDLAGTCWDSVITKDYRSHFPQFACQQKDGITRWEFSLMVFADDYSDDEPMKSRVSLYEGKLLGFSMAYNDDDQPDTDPVKSVRDNFFGSVPVAKRSWNDHWMNADGFAPALLVVPAYIQ